MDVQTPEDRRRVGVRGSGAVTRIGSGGLAEGQDALFPQGGAKAVSPFLALQMFGGAGSCNVAIDLGVTGFSTSNADSCASGTIAIGHACNAIRRGDADVILAGGAE